jgi:TetR/AcrR family transcriptional regulator, transcriptional repressor for nem operon
MRYEKGHKATTRKRNIEVAAKCFLKEGIDSVGIDSLMAEAGLTHGGFYAHFKSKEELVHEALAYAIAQMRTRLAIADESGGLESLVRKYLGPLHRAESERGCAFASLMTELIRHNEPTRSILADELEVYVNLIASYIGNSEESVRRHKALQIFGVMIGTLQLARAVPDETAANRILQAGADAALALSGSPQA